MESIKIENLTFTYPNSKTAALKNISLHLEQGEFITLCGKSGCGKTTLLRLLKPLLAPRGEKVGTISFNGKDVAELSQKEQTESIGFVFQNPDNQIVTDKVWHELAFGLESLSYSKTEIRTRVSEMASFFGIQTWFHKKVTELSGGQKHLLNLASVMVMQPKVLILDEPTSQLDPIAAQDFLEAVYKINRELGVTVILTEHRLETAFSMSDRVIVMENGKIVADAVPQKVGEILYKTNNEMLFALPTPIRVYYSKENNMPCPINVRDARKWLSKMPVNKNITFKSKEPIKKEAVIKLSDIWFRYEKDLPDVLKGASFSVCEGEFYAIVGGNGSGKTTTLSIIAGLSRPYRGKLSIEKSKKIAALPQNPQSLFVKKTVLLDIFETIAKQKISKAEQELKTQNVIKLCELEELLDRHPYDLSGGEQQRVALAKVLLTKPDILLLDEPTKGLDAHFKEKLARMLKGLQKSGITILMVSHDIEFCAKYADRCGMFFDGNITCEDEPRKFFSGNSFYTTSANRISRDILENAVLDEDIIKAIDGNLQSVKSDSHLAHIEYTRRHEMVTSPDKKDKKLTKKNMFFGVIFAILFGITKCLRVVRFDNWLDYIFELLSIIVLGLSLANFIPKRKVGQENLQVTKVKRKIAKRTIVAAFIVLLLIPITIFFGVYYLGDRKYYFISLLVILETMIPFALIFEGRKPQAREIVIISVLCSLAVAGRCAFYMLPQFKPVLAIVIIAGVCFGGETGFLVGAVTAFVSNFFFGQTPYTPWQMFSFGMVGFLAGVLFQKGFLRKTKTGICVFGFLATLVIYGVIMNVSTVILSNPMPKWEKLMITFIMSIPFDLIHATATAFFLYFIAEPMIEKLDRIKVKYGLVE